MSIWHAVKLEDLDAREGEEFLALDVPAELGDAVRSLAGEDRDRVEAWLRADLELARGLARGARV